MQIGLGRAVLRVLGVVLLVVSLGAVFVPQNSNGLLHWVATAPTVVVVVLLASFLRLPQVLKQPRTDVVMAVAGALVTALFALALRYHYGWDAVTVMGVARDLSEGRAPTSRLYEYLSMYPNNLALLAIDRAAVGVSGWLGMATDDLVIGANAVGVGVTVFAVHRMVRPVAGPGPAVAAQLATTFFIGTSPWMSVPYTDAFVLPVVTVAAAVTCAALRLPREQSRRRWTLTALALLLAMVAYVIKTTTVVLPVAAALTLVLVVGASRGHGIRRAACASVAVILLALAFVAGAGLLNTASVQASGLDQSRLEAGMSPPPLWWIANGMVEQVSADGTHSYGSYSRTMVDAIRGQAQVAADRYARDVISQQWSERGVIGTTEFYARKAVWNWQDGMFSAWGEGYDARPGQIIGTGPVTRAIEVVNGPQGSAYAARSRVATGAWLGLLLIIALGALRARPRREVVLVALVVLGIGAFTLLVQGRARYLFAFAPLVCVLAGMLQGSLPSLRRVTRQRRSQSIEPPTTASTAAKAVSSPRRRS